MDIYYATIPIFGGEHKTLYRETWLYYIISDESNPTHHPIYAIDNDLGFSILHLTEFPQSPLEIKKTVTNKM
jgi:hypothetical protein